MPASASSSPTRRIVVLVLLAIFFGFVLNEVLNPFADAEYQEIPHGDHVHYRPKDYDPNVPLDNFPTVRPDDDEMILPNGRVVPRDPSDM